jgi:hypothetical protein
LSNQNRYYRGKLIHGRWKRFFLTLAVILLILLIFIHVFFQHRIRYTRDGVVIQTKDEVLSENSNISSPTASDPLVIETADYSNMKAVAGETTTAIHAIYVSSAYITDDFVSTYSEILSNYDCIILELKPSSGQLVWNSSVKTATDYNLNGTVNIVSLITSLKEKGLRVAAQLSCAKDDLMVTRNPALALHTADGKVYSDANGSWIDPTNVDAKQYIIDLSKELISAGIDELWFSNVNQPDVSPSTFKYSSDISQNLSISEIVDSYSLYFSNQIRGTGTTISVLLEESSLTSYESNSSFTQDLSFFGKVFDRICCFTTSGNAAAELQKCSEYLPLGTPEYRFVPICNDSVPDTKSYAYVLS